MKLEHGGQDECGNGDNSDISGSSREKMQDELLLDMDRRRDRKDQGYPRTIAKKLGKNWLKWGIER